MAQVNANEEEGNPNGLGAAPQPEQQPGLVPYGVPNGVQVPNGAAAVALPAAAPVVAVVVANPVIANLAGALAHPGPMHPQFDVEAPCLGPPATKSNRNFNIHARIQ